MGWGGVHLEKASDGLSGSLGRFPCSGWASMSEMVFESLLCYWWGSGLTLGVSIDMRISKGWRGGC